MIAGFLGDLLEDRAHHGIDHLGGEHGEVFLHVFLFLHGELPHLALGHVVGQGLLQGDHHGGIGMRRGVDESLEGAEIGPLVMVEEPGDVFLDLFRQALKNSFTVGIFVDFGRLEIEIHEILLGMNRLFQGFLHLEFLGHGHLLFSCDGWEERSGRGNLLARVSFEQASLIASRARMLLMYSSPPPSC